MKLSKRTIVKLTERQTNIVGHMNYSDYKLWNFVDGLKSWNADAVGAYNILRLYRQRTGKQIQMADIRMPYVYKVAV